MKVKVLKITCDGPPLGAKARQNTTGVRRLDVRSASAKVRRWKVTQQQPANRESGLGMTSYAGAGCTSHLMQPTAAEDDPVGILQPH